METELSPFDARIAVVSCEVFIGGRANEPLVHGLAKVVHQNGGDTALSDLGIGVVRTIPKLFEPEVSQQWTEEWANSWYEVSKEHDQLLLPSKLLDGAVAWRATKEQGYILAAPTVVRFILEEMLLPVADWEPTEKLQNEQFIGRLALKPEAT